MSATMPEMVKAVKDHAAKNYNQDGWDYVVECYEDTDIAEIIGNARTAKGAIAKVKAVVKTQDSYRKDIQAEIF